MGLRHPTKKSFLYAYSGIKTAFRNEPNLTAHVIIATMAVILGIVLGLSRVEWLFIIFTIFWVISLELLNTVIEAVVNLVSPEIREHAKIAKDVSAACVLLGAILSLIVAGFIFLPKLAMLF